jgi:hypothetical protein
MGSNPDLYIVNASEADSAAVDEVCVFILGLLASTIVSVEVDGFPEEDIPDDVRAALTHIRCSAPFRRRLFRKPKQTFMAIALDWKDDDNRTALAKFIPYSIHAECFDALGQCIATFSDSGSSISANLTEDQARKLKNVLPQGISLRALRGA